MKLRSGFVSNSSSSSFCIYGTFMELDELIEKVKANGWLTDEELEEMEENEDWYELEEKLNEKTDLEVYASEDQFWIGKSWSNIGDDETGGEFKESVKTELGKVFGEVDCQTHEEEIYS